MSNLVESEITVPITIAFDTNKNNNVNYKITNTNSSKGKVISNSTKLTILPTSTTPTILQASTSPPNLDPNLFTFKPKLTPKTELLTQNLMNFYERQNQHLKKQSDLVS